MKRFLVCTDLSETSDLVLKEAEVLRKRNGGTIDLLYVSETGLHLEDDLIRAENMTYKKVILGAMKDSIDVRTSVQIQNCGATANIIYREGRVSEVIVNMANEGSYDLLIMGHGQKPLIHQILGSNAFKVLSSAPIPVLVIKKTLGFKKIIGLVDESRAMEFVIKGTLDFSREFQFTESEFVSLWIDFQKPFGNSEEGLVVESRLREAVDASATAAEKTMLRTEPTRELKLGYPLDKILNEDKADLVVLKRFSEGNPRRAYVGSTTKKLLEIFAGNILVLPA